MDIKNKKLIDRASSTYEYTLFCRKCYKTISVTQIEKNQVELARLKCECSKPTVTVSMGEPTTFTDTPLPEKPTVEIKIPPPNKPHKKKKGKR